ncbi:kinase-like domain-containing protein [Coniochaeta sp. 2T2.1]|nr:kinase-like domain-containing protein [Coniochaeta sp. 2T2.1]
MQPLSYLGSTADFYRTAAKGVILKSPMKVSEENPNREGLETANKNAIDIERRILETLGSHPRIVPFVQPPLLYMAGELSVVDKYLGVSANGIHLSEAGLGDLQKYIDSHNTGCEQAAEAVVYIHKKGVIHSDLRPENLPVDQIQGSYMSLWLCDFGGSTCARLGLDGGHLPDTPFFDPRMKWESTPATDIFSLGSIFYTNWPYRDSPPEWSSVQEKQAYEAQVDGWFKQGHFPPVSHVIGGNVIRGCWDHQYKTAEEVLNAVRSEIVAPTRGSVCIDES